MSAPKEIDCVVIQTRDRTGRTKLTWYADVHEAERGNPIASVGAGGLWIDPEAPTDVGRRAINLYRDELTRDPWQDLTYLVTHTVDGDGYLHPVKAVAQ